MITIYKNPNGDTRTANGVVPFEEFQKANLMHIKDVRDTMEFIAELAQNAGELHDCTKKTQEKMFYEDFKNTMTTGANFEESMWYKLHITAERHHLLAHCPNDVNLIDVLEMIADMVCAGMARSGEIPQINIPSDILQKAVSNTVDLLKDKIELVDPNYKAPNRPTGEYTNTDLAIDPLGMDEDIEYYESAYKEV